MKIEERPFPRSRAALPTAALLAAALVAAGCSHDAPKFQLGPDDPPEPGTEGAARSLADATTPPEESREFLAQLRLAGESVAGDGGAAAVLATAPAAALEALPGGVSGPPPAVRAARRALAAAGAAGADGVLPTDLVGTTLVWDGESGRYAPDAEAAGGPPDGVRILLYRPDPATGRPAEPLEEVGYAELTDASAGGDIHLSLRAVRTDGGSPTVLLDYFVRAEASQSGEMIDISFASDGYLAGDGERLEFSLSQGLELGETVVRFDSSNEISVPARGVHVSLEFDGEGTETTGSASLRLEIRNGGETVLLEVEAEDETLDGRLVRDGETVVLIGGTAEQPTFSRPDGTPVAGDALEPLEELLAGADEVFAFTDEVFAPLDPLILFQVGEI